MNKEKIIDAMGDISPEFVREAKPKGLRRYIPALGAAAAVLVVGLGLLAVLPKVFRNDPPAETAGGLQTEGTDGTGSEIADVPVVEGAFGIIYSSENVSVRLLDTESGEQITEICWDPLTEEQAFSENSLVVTGEALNVRTAEVTYRCMDVDLTDVITLFELKVDEVLRGDSGGASVVTIGFGTANGAACEVPAVTEGRRYLVFLSPPKEDDPMELGNYLDFWAGRPKDLLIEEVGGDYIVIDLFAGLPFARRFNGETGLTASDAGLRFGKLSGNALEAMLERSALVNGAELEEYIRNYGK